MVLRLPVELVEQRQLGLELPGVPGAGYGADGDDDEEEAEGGGGARHLACLWEVEE